MASKGRLSTELHPCQIRTKPETKPLWHSNGQRDVAQYQYTTRADKINGQLQQDMGSFKYDPAKDIRCHINGIRVSISNKVREMENPVQEKYVISEMLSSLPASFWHS
jgi:hypothetical protein